MATSKDKLTTLEQLRMLAEREKAELDTKAPQSVIGSLPEEYPDLVTYINSKNKPEWGSIERVTDYLYVVSYESYDYQDGYAYMEKYKGSASCSVVRKGKIIGRNLDWTYGNEANFVIKTKASNGRFASIGVALGTPELTEEIAKSGEYNEAYKVLPFLTSDVLNECGVYVSGNIVYAGDKGYTTGTGGGEQSICALMLPRLIADYARTAKNAIGLIRSMDVYAPLKVIGSEIHLMVCDNQDTYVVEFIENTIKVFSNTDTDYDPIPNGKEILTNFYLDGWNGEIKAATMGDAEEEIRSTGLTDHAMGLERYQLLLNGYDSVDSTISMGELLSNVKYTKAYDRAVNPFWYTEFVGEYESFGNLTIYSSADDYAGVVDYSIEKYEQHQRDKSSWYTAHTSVYNLENLEVYVYPEEHFDRRYVFKLDVPGSATNSGHIEDLSQGAVIEFYGGSASDVMMGGNE